MIQSEQLYKKDNARWGVKAGEQERSFCMFQIHEPDHRNTIERLGLHDYKTNVHSCIKMARIVYEEAGYKFTPWSVYNNTIALARR